MLKRKKFMKKKITLVDCPGGDWEGLYVNGKLIMENHRLELDDVLDAIGVNYQSITADDDWMAEVGTLPDKLSEVKQAKD